MPEPTRLVVFTGDPAYSVRRTIVEIDEAIPGLEWLIVWQTPHKTVRQLLKNQRQNLRRNGWRWVPYQAADALRRLRRPRPGRTAEQAPGREFTLAQLAARSNVRIERVPSLVAPGALALISEFAPRLGLSLAAPILKRATFSLPELGTINQHKGKVPEFRGMPPAFWERWFDQKSVGCTVHWVDDKLDTGRIVAEQVLPVAAHANVRGLQLQLDEIGATLMRDAVRDVLAGAAPAHEQPPFEGQTHRKPTLAQVSEMQRRERELHGPRHAVKEVVLAGRHVALKLARRLQAPRLTVLLYHRVSDDARDNLTVGIAQFERQMALLREHCDLWSIEEVLSMRTVPRSHRPQVAVTFDDGYEDNAVHAAPILRRHGVPAAFFVSTGIVASTRRFPHDVRRGNPHIATMSWEQIRQLRRWGFTVGSHTVNHIDIASEPAEVVRDELLRSRDDLRRELGVDEPILAYPYGGRQHMTAERLPWVREAGYVGCLSAYGGSNVATIDPFNVVRRGINWQFSDRAFLLEALGR